MMASTNITPIGKYNLSLQSQTMDYHKEEQYNENEKQDIK